MPNRIYWKVGEHEIELEGNNAFIEKYLKQFFVRVSAPKHVSAGPDIPSKIVAASRTSLVVPSPAEFVREKKPQGGTETLIVLAKYNEDYRSKSHFTKTDLNKLADEAKLKKIHDQYYTNAVKQGLLRSVGRGTYALTISGEDAVVAMPAGKKS